MFITLLPYTLIFLFFYIMYDFVILTLVKFIFTFTFLLEKSTCCKLFSDNKWLLKYLLTYLLASSISLGQTICGVWKKMLMLFVAKLGIFRTQQVALVQF